MQWDLPLVSLHELGISWFHSHSVNPSRSPVAYNFTYPVDSRFSAPNGEFGSLYLGSDAYCAFIETHGASLGMDKDLGMRTISEKKLTTRCVCPATLRDGARPLLLEDLSGGSGWGKLGGVIDGRICTSVDRQQTQKWAFALWRHKQKPDGILYRARNDLEKLAVNLFDRAGNVLVPDCSRNVLRDPAKLADILDWYHIALDPDLDPKEHLALYQMSPN